MSSGNINNDYYKSYFQFSGKAKWKEKIWSEAFGDAYPEGLEHYGYLTNNDIEVLTSLIDIAAGEIILDIGCGKGGPGLRLAEILDAKLLGIDIIQEAVDQAKLFKSQFKLNHEALFEVGEFYNIPLDDSLVDVAISIDSVWTAPDKDRTFNEVCRVLKPGGKFIFTSWDILGNDSIILYQNSALKFISRQETPNWKLYQKKVYEGILKYQKELLLEMGEAAHMLLYEAQTSSPFLNNSVRRIYCLEKP